MFIHHSFSSLPKDEWLKEVIETPFGEMRRSDMIRTFITQGLTPLVYENGYVWKNEGVIFQYLATGLYLNRSKHLFESDWSMIPKLNTQYAEEDLEHYTNVFDAYTWEPFWKIWSEWEDLRDDRHRGPDLRAEIEDFVWTMLDLLRSPETNVVDSIYGYTEEEMDGGARDQNEWTWQTRSKGDRD